MAPIVIDILIALDKSGCPICRVRTEWINRFYYWLLTQNYYAETMVLALMESGGLCRRHAQRLLDRPVVYQTSVMYQYLVNDAINKLAALADRARNESRKSKRKPKRFQSKPTGECPACVEERWVEESAAHALAHVLDDDTALEQYRKGDALCLSHFHSAIEFASPRVAAALAEIEIAKLETLVRDFKEYFRKVDYRFADEPKGEEQTAWRRAIERMMGSVLSRGGA